LRLKILKIKNNFLEKKLNAHQQIPDPEISKIQEEESSTGVAATYRQKSYTTVHYIDMVHL